MTRQQRRAQEREEQRTADRVDAFRKTNPMGEEAYQAGYKAGFDAAVSFTFKVIYAAVILALKKLHGFGQLRASRVLIEVDNNVAHCLTTQELIDEVWEKAGLRLSFDEPFDRIEVKKKRRAA